MRKIRKESKDSNEFGKKLIEENLSISMAQGRRLWVQLESIKEND